RFVPRRQSARSGPRSCRATARQAPSGFARAADRYRRGLGRGRRGHRRGVYARAAGTGARGRAQYVRAAWRARRPADEYLITVAVSRTRVAAGGSVTLAGRVTDHGRALAGVRVRLFERLAG